MRYQLFMPKRDAGNTMRAALAVMVGQAVTQVAPEYECVYEDEAPAYRLMDRKGPEFVLDLIWRRHNVGDEGHGDRPRAQEIRSMCVGDIVRFSGGSTFLTASIGFRETSGAELPVLDDSRPWQEVSHAV